MNTVLFAIVLAAADSPAGPLSPADSVKTFRLADPNLVVELVASEPQVVAPVAMAWDAAGRIYVVEMSDYPLGPVGGKVKLLKDRDAAGVYHSAVEFANGLPFPTSALPIEDGLLVAAAPDLWFFKDADGDGKAEIKRRVAGGFAEGNQQLRVNGLTYGLDGWIYGANGRSGGTIKREGAALAVPIPRHDFRFRWRGGPVEALAGMSQFGLAFDDGGERFLSWNTAPFRHAVFEESLLARNPHLPSASTIASVADPADSGRLYPIAARPTTFNRESVEFFNASCGNAIYRDDLLGAGYAGNMFVCEPLLNLIHRRRLESSGTTFIARRADAGKEFLAAADPWFHPVNVATGPDGCLYVADFYRQWVEHPQFVPEKLRGSVDWRTGAGHGRIWRIRRKDSPPREVASLAETAGVG
ncbi:MAG TPA: PVC-type heme-binding CxxCH protein, partial [Planctomycetia bacterium]|nr:PVC-type heme-binding CxxCH protein [Planctomycetia bacterium]